MNWESTEQIITYFDLKLNDNNLSSVRKAIIKSMAGIHPDRNNKSFMSDKDEKRWHELSSAKRFLDEQISHQALIPISELPAIIKSLQEITLNPLEQRVATLKQEARNEFKSQSYIPRIGSGVFAAICGFLFTFSSTVKDHPLLGELLSNRGTQIFLLVAMFYSGIFFLMLWYRERRLESKVEWLTSEEGIRATFSVLIQWDRFAEQENPQRFTLRKLTDVVSGRHIARFETPIRRSMEGFPLFFSSRIHGSIAEKVAKIQIDTLKERGILVELPQRGFEKIYELKKDAMSELSSL